MPRGIGPIQQAITDALYDPQQVIELTTHDLAERCLGRTDKAAMHQIRRAVDALAKRELVETWVDSVPTSVRYGTQNDETRARFMFTYRREIPNAQIGPSLYRPSYEVEVETVKTRIRWVRYKLEARPIAEQLAFLDQWMREAQAQLDGIEEAEPNSIGEVLNALRIQTWTGNLSRWTNQRDELRRQQ